MARLSIPGLLLAAAAAYAQHGTEPRPKASDYPVHSEAGKLPIGAEYLLHSFSGARQTFIASDYLVVEVALYPAKGESVTVSLGSFSLRLNNRKQAIAPHPPGMVAGSLKYPDWEQHPQLEGSAGIGDTTVILGRPANVPRFPGDPTAQPRMPRPPRVPEDNPGGIEKTPRATAHEVAVDAALLEGPAKSPTSGFLYFPYRGKIKAIRSLELLYSGPEGSTVLRLM